MCGICMILYFDSLGENSISCDPYLQDDITSYEQLNRNRGPDASSYSEVLEDKFQLKFFGSVLWLQGNIPTLQPFTDGDGNILLWNGDILNDLQVPGGQSDTIFLSNLLNASNENKIINIFSSIKGPWAFIYYSQAMKRLFFGRDVFGRHSLLMTDIANGKERLQSFVLTSVGHENSTDLIEVPALGLFYIDLNELKKTESNVPVINLIPWNTVLQDSSALEDFKYFMVSKEVVPSPIKDSLNTILPSDEIKSQLESFSTQEISLHELSNLNIFDDDYNQLLSHMITAVERRVLKTCPHCCVNCTKSPASCTHCRIAVLFSGGVDSAILALLLDRILPKGETIDLINVAFPLKKQIKNEVMKKNKNRNKKINYLPNVEKLSDKLSDLSIHESTDAEICTNTSDDPKPTNLKNEPDNSNLSESYEVPDRITGRNCYEQFMEISPDRTWNFVEVNVTAALLSKSRHLTIRHLLRPHSSVLDDSIGCALYWAATGQGKVEGVEYTSPARVLLCGLGADEQLCGYSRHRATFNNSGYKGLLDEVTMELKRLHHRNLGRDNRVIAQHARAPRYPFLDEDVVSLLNSLPLWHKCNLLLPRGIGEKLLLRVMAYRLGLKYSASLHKRAIQFGSRIAKMDNKKEKGNQACDRLN